VVRLRAVAVAAVAGLLLAGIPAALADGVQPPAPDSTRRLLVRLEQPASLPEEQRLAEAVGARHAGQGRPGVFSVEVSESRVDEVLSRLRARSEVDLAEADIGFSTAEMSTAAVTPNEECFTGCTLTFDDGSSTVRLSQTEMFQIGAPDAWSVTKGDPEILVAVIDTDVDANQPDLIGKVIEGRNFSGDTRPDESGHGTAVAGLIAAQPDNGQGIAGLGWSTRVLSVRVLDAEGKGFASEIAAGIRYAVDYPGVKVVNLSLQQDVESVDQRSDELELAIKYAVTQGVLVVAAAGNQSRGTPGYPANYPGVLSVAAVDHADGLASFSNYGPWVDLAAPGVGVLSVAPACDCWSTPSGTSFAAPFVAAAAALVMAAEPALTDDPERTVDRVTARLKHSAAPVAGTGIDFEAGRLDVAKAVGYQAAAPPTPVPDPAPAPNPSPAPTSTGGTAPAPTGTTPDPAPAPSPQGTQARKGYWLVGSDGGIFAFGDARFLGSTGAVRLNKPIVGMAATPAGAGYWLVASDGGIFAFGDGGFFGSTGAVRLNRPIVGMAPTPSGRGYWLVASDGGIFAFGDAGFFGSTGAVPLNKPIVGMTSTPTGQGYWLVASDGGIFAFGDARFSGSTGAVPLNKPIVGMASTPTGRGYWLVASDGGIFAFGDARFLGSTGGRGVTDIVAISPVAGGAGYWLTGANGSVYSFGSAPALGHLGATPLNRPIVGFTGR
jgi:subtilisin family serine protease